MMKKILLITTLFLSFNIFGQNGTKGARKKAVEFARVLQLTEVQTEKVYEISLVHIRKLDKLRRANLGASDEDFKKLIMPDVIEYHNKLFAYLGEDKRIIWRKYVKRKKARRSTYYF